MTKRLFFLLLTFYAVGVYAGNKSDQTPAIQSVTIQENGEWSGRYKGGEIYGSCEDIELTETDIFEYFKGARVVTEREYNNDLDKSNCYVNGSAVLKDGKKVEWMIDGMQRGELRDAKTTKYFYCETCRNENYDVFTLTRQQSNKVQRPVIKNVNITKNGAYSGNSDRQRREILEAMAVDPDEEMAISSDRCKAFKLSNADIFAFFKLARSVTARDYNYGLDMPNCYVSGSAVLKNGKKAEWKIDEMRRGLLSDGKTEKYFHCDKCRNENYSAFTLMPKRERDVIQSVIIETNGGCSRDENPDGCKLYTLEETDIVAFFKRAHFVTAREYSHDLSISDCYISGSAVLKNGKKATWSIDTPMKRGALSDGRTTKYFYCGSCFNEPWRSWNAE